MNYKDGVYTSVHVIKNGFEEVLSQSSAIQAAQHIADGLMQEMFGVELTITAILDGKHMEGSKHYDGDAFDQRTWFIKNKAKEYIDEDKYATELRIRLGSNYDVVIHKGSHGHIEFDKK